eukprot:Opistho-2@52765
MASDWSQYALLIIDVQNDFYRSAEQVHFPNFPAQVASLLELCRREGIEVVHIREEFDPSGKDWLPYQKLRGRACCLKGSSLAEVLPCARELPGEVVFAKSAFDGFRNAELAPYLRSKGKRFVLCAGLVTTVCVLATALSAIQEGFLAAVVDDACADSPSGAHISVLDRYRSWAFETVTVPGIVSMRSHWNDLISQIDAFTLEGPSHQQNH